jgi:ribosomal RNA-processing protein 36
MQRPVQLRTEANEEADHYSSSPSPREQDSSSETRDTEASDISSEGPDHEDGEHTEGDDCGNLAEDSEVGSAGKSALKSISFGTLAEAQEKFQPKSRKRKLPADFEEEAKEARNEPPTQDRDSEDRFRQKPARQSKHAPTILSSRQQVTRKRDVFEPSPAVKSRDPRFDPTVQASNPDRNAIEKANKNYSFLTSYQAEEILDLKAQIKKAKDPDTVAELKHRVMAFENKIRAVEARQRTRGIETQHKQKEKELIRTGQKAKPYYLKPSEIKKLAETERLENMGKKARDKSMKRKQKREKSKESRQMPRVRRE